MRKPHPLLDVRVLAAAAFAAAAALAIITAIFTASAIEGRAERVVRRVLIPAGMDWVNVSADGLIVTLSGTAPTEAKRFRAVSIAGTVVDSSRVIDAMSVTPASAITAPRFSLELLRNDDGISMIGLVPQAWDAARQVELVNTLVTDGDVTNMLETADFAIPAGWVEAVDFGMVALRLLPRSKISVAADGVAVTAISDSPAQKQKFETDLARAAPKGLRTTFDISAPRPVITPFTLRFVIDSEGPRFDACSADSERGSVRLLSAAVAAGMEGKGACTLGLGAPSPRWTEAGVAVIAAMAQIGQGQVTISDVDVSLIAADTVSQADFDRVVGELTTRLPDVFSLKATLTPKPQQQTDQGPPQFTATLSPEGEVQVRGRLPDDRSREAIDAFARARFGADSVYVATRQDETLPAGWVVRVLAGLGGLAELAHGSVLVQQDRVEVKGVTGSLESRARIARLLSDQLGQGAAYAVAVTYDPKLDPANALPKPEDCLARANAIVARGEITFAPGEATIDATARSALSDLAEVLRDCAAVRMEIGGHTDSQGRAETNLRLSQQRAEAVLTALADQRVPVANLSAKGYGATEPVADNAIEEGRVANRRIAFRLVQPDGEAQAASAVLLPDAEDASPEPSNPEPDAANPGDFGSGEAAADGVPMDDAAGDGVPMDDSLPVEDDPAAAPTEDAPADDTSTDDRPADDTPADDTPQGDAAASSPAIPAGATPRPRPANLDDTAAAQAPDGQAATSDTPPPAAAEPQPGNADPAPQSPVAPPVNATDQADATTAPATADPDTAAPAGTAPVPDAAAVPPAALPDPTPADSAESDGTLAAPLPQTDATPAPMNTTPVPARAEVVAPPVPADSQGPGTAPTAALPPSPAPAAPPTGPVTGLAPPATLGPVILPAPPPPADAQPAPTAAATADDAPFVSVAPQTMTLRPKRRPGDR